MTSFLPVQRERRKGNARCLLRRSNILRAGSRDELERVRALLLVLRDRLSKGGHVDVGEGVGGEVGVGSGSAGVEVVQVRGLARLVLKSGLGERGQDGEGRGDEEEGRELDHGSGRGTGDWGGGRWGGTV